MSARMPPASKLNLAGSAFLVIASALCLMSWVSHAEDAKAAPAPPAVAAAPESSGVETATDEVAVRPQEVVESLHAVLLECMKRSSELGFDGRYRLLAENLDETFDTVIMARTSIGKVWNQLDNEQRKRWVALTRQYSAANYADKFDGYSDQHFETLGEEASARGTVIVRTEMVQPSDKNVKFDYRLRKSKGDWRIIDVQLDGRISELALRRADYRSVIEQGEDVASGLETLIARLGEKIEGFQNE